jgi:hypothetical protein
MRVLVACERSGVVREAFRKLGHEAWSCDIVPTDDGSKFHIQADAVDVTNNPWRYQQLSTVVLGDWWDLMIAHPPCTYLCNSGVCWLSEENKYGELSDKARDRWRNLDKAAHFFRQLWMAKIPHIAIENPIPHKYASLGPYDQIIQPWMFGHPESKATCLWLKNLPKLVETNNVKHIWKLAPKSKAQRIHMMGPSKDRSRLRSVTYQGIADAFAQQWSEYICKA